VPGAGIGGEHFDTPIARGLVQDVGERDVDLVRDVPDVVPGAAGRARIGRPKEVLKTLERDELNLKGRPKLAQSTREEPEEPVQIPMFCASTHPILQEIQEADLNEMKPLDALNFLDKLKRRLQEEDL
jgi:hypothetical protein